MGKDMKKDFDYKLRFDDEAIDALIEGQQGRGGTSAEALDLWKIGGASERTAECAQAVAAVLINYPQMIRRFPYIEDIETSLEDTLALARAEGELQSAARLADLKTRLQNAVYFATTSESLHPFSEASKDLPRKITGRPIETVGDVPAFLKESNQWDEFQTKQICQRYHSTRDNRDEMIFLRKKAFHHFLEKKYEKAERIYRSFLAVNFEVPGTLCHLVRVMLMTDRVEEAAEYIESAWINRNKASGYVSTRILFFKIFLEMLAHRDVSEKVSSLYDALQKQKEHMNWVIEPVLEYMAEKIGRKNLDALTSFSNAINNLGRVH